MPHPLDHGVETIEQPGHHHFGCHQLSDRQLTDREEPSGGSNKAAVANSLPPDCAEVLAREDGKARSPGRDIVVDQLIGFLHEQWLTIGRLEMQ